MLEFGVAISVRYLGQEQTHLHHGIFEERYVCLEIKLHEKLLWPNNQPRSLAHLCLLIFTTVFMMHCIVSSNNFFLFRKESRDFAGSINSFFRWRMPVPFLSSILRYFFFSLFFFRIYFVQSRGTPFTRTRVFVSYAISVTWNFTIFKHTSRACGRLTCSRHGHVRKSELQVERFRERSSRRDNEITSIVLVTQFEILRVVRSSNL